MPNQYFQHLNGSHDGIRLPEDQRVYAIGDIHGRLDLLRKLHGIIEDDMAENPKDANTVVYLGDYVDRGPDSASVIETLATSAPAGTATAHIMGNHDYFMVDFLDGTGDLGHWLMNGGDDTLRSYGIDDSAEPAQLQEALLDVIPDHHLSFLKGLSLSHSVGSLFFAHAGINPDVSLEAQTPEDLMWIREPFLSWPKAMDTVVVHGHTPRPEPEVARHRIGTDTLAWKSGHLTAAVLENGHVRFLST